MLRSCKVRTFAMSVVETLAKRLKCVLFIIITPIIFIFSFNAPSGKDLRGKKNKI